MMKSNRCVLLTVTNLMGQIVLREVDKEEVYHFVFGDDKEYNKITDSKNITKTFFLGSKYIVLKKGDEEKLYERLRKVVLVVSRDKSKVLGGYSSFNDVKRDKDLAIYTSTRSMNNYLTSGKLIPADKVYLISGQEGVDLLKKLGYLDEVLKEIGCYKGKKEEDCGKED